MVSDDAMAWKKRMGQQQERRKDTEDLWSRLDDLVTNASDFPSPRQPCTLSTVLEPNLLSHGPAHAPDTAPRAAWPR